MSLSATLCYILYHAVDWPETSSAVITSNGDGINHHRCDQARPDSTLARATTGDVILGLGATVFLFPYMQLNRLAETVERKISLPAEPLEAFVSQHLLESGHFGEYARNTIARYEDLQALAITLARGA